MRILLIEDDDLKRGRLTTFIESHFSNCTVVPARSIHTGVKLAIDDAVDVLILDMTLPPFDVGEGEDGGNLKAFGGKEVMRQLEARDLTIPWIVVTQFTHFGEGGSAMNVGELDEDLAESMPEAYLGLVQYRSQAEGWKESLLSKLRSVIAANY
jgi:DNA-binding NarL/FixJ family response regulator